MNEIPYDKFYGYFEVDQNNVWGFVNVFWI